MSSEKPGCLSALFGFRAKPNSNIAFPYRLENSFLSPAEIAFFQTLKKLVGENLIIFSKPSLREFISVVNRSDQTAFNRINQKHIDFLVCDPNTFQPRFAIELDDSSHRQTNRIERDKFVDQVFTGINLPLIHIPVQRAYDVEQINGIIRNALQIRDMRTTTEGKPITSQNEPPLCPTHSIPMILRTARQTGEKFWGCPNYPQCREIIKIT